MKQDQVSYNQTQFSSVEPLLDPVTPPIDDQEPKTPPTKKTNSKRLLVIGLGVMGVVIVVLLAVLLFSSPKTEISDEVMASPSPETETIRDDEFTQRLNQLKTDLEAADPIKRDTPFPQVDMAISLEVER